MSPTKILGTVILDHTIPVPVVDIPSSVATMQVDPILGIVDAGSMAKGPEPEKDADNALLGYAGT